MHRSKWKNATADERILVFTKKAYNLELKDISLL